MQEKKKLRPVSAELVNEILNGGFGVSSYGCGSGSGSGGTGSGSGCGSGSVCGSGSGSGSGSGDGSGDGSGCGCGDDGGSGCGCGDDGSQGKLSHSSIPLEYPEQNYTGVFPWGKIRCNGYCYVSKEEGSTEVKIDSAYITAIIGGTYQDMGESHDLSGYNTINATEFRGSWNFDGNLNVEIYRNKKSVTETLHITATFGIYYDTGEKKHKAKADEITII